MSSLTHGESTSAEVTNISAHGVWLFYDGQEYFAPYSEFPWFQDATLKQIHNLEVPRPGHFHWPDLDVDLSVAILSEPENFELVSK